MFKNSRRQRVGPDESKGLTRMAAIPLKDNEGTRHTGRRSSRKIWKGVMAACAKPNCLYIFLWMVHRPGLHVFVEILITVFPPFVIMAIASKSPVLS